MKNTTVLRFVITLLTLDFLPTWCAKQHTRTFEAGLPHILFVTLTFVHSLLIAEEFICKCWFSSFPAFCMKQGRAGKETGADALQPGTQIGKIQNTPGIIK